MNDQPIDWQVRAAEAELRRDDLMNELEKMTKFAANLIKQREALEKELGRISKQTEILTVSAQEIMNVRNELEQRNKEFAIVIGDLQSCQEENERLRAACASAVKALDRCRDDFEILICRGDLADEPRAHQTLVIVKAALAGAKD